MGFFFFFFFFFWGGGGVCFFVFVHVCMCGFLRRIQAVFSAGSTKVMVNFFLLPLKVNNYYVLVRLSSVALIATVYM